MAMKSFGPVLVTGANTGIGRAITEMLAEKGHLVYATARRKTALQELGRIPNVNPVLLDVRRPTDVKRAAEAVKKKGAGLYGLVNNAGIGYDWPVVEETADELHNVFDVNVFGAHRMIQALLPFLVKSGGRIVNISSISGFGVSRNLGSYQMSKHALEVYSDSLALTLKKYGVTVCLIEPGSFRSAIMVNMAKVTRDMARSHKLILMKDEVREIVRGLDKQIEDTVKCSAPVPVAESVMDALFSKRPKHRYMVATDRGDTDWAVDALLLKLIQANNGSSFALSRNEMHARIDKIWDREMKRPR
jgi:NAD(P)-dependent dehydrogenase (short-subunit alcohol dehydrogenase family)